MLNFDVLGLRVYVRLMELWPKANLVLKQIVKAHRSLVFLFLFISYYFLGGGVMWRGVPEYFSMTLRQSKFVLFAMVAKRSGYFHTVTTTIFLFIFRGCQQANNCILMISSMLSVAADGENNVFQNSVDG